MRSFVDKNVAFFCNLALVFVFNASLDIVKIVKSRGSIGVVSFFAAFLYFRSVPL